MQNNINKPPRIKPRLKSAPKIRQVYWCNFPKDAQLPEFWKTRPVIIFSKKSSLYGTVVVIPCSTKETQDKNSSVQLEDTSIGGWAICDKPYTVAVSRLSINKGKIEKVSKEIFKEIVKKVFSFLPNQIE